MKKYINYLILSFIVLIININSVNAVSECVYEFQGSVLRVTDNEGQVSIDYNIDNVDLFYELEGRSYDYFYNSSLEEKDVFYNDSGFYCPKIYVLKNIYNSNPKKTTFEITNKTPRPPEDSFLGLSWFANCDEYFELNPGEQVAEYKCDDTGKKKAKDSLESSISFVNDSIAWAQNYSISSCIIEGKVITRLEDCKAEYNTKVNVLSSTSENIKGDISDYCLEPDDPKIEEFNKKYEEFLGYLPKVDEVLEEEDKKIKEELGLVDDNLNYDKNHHSTWLGGGGGKVMDIVKRLYNVITIGIPLLIIILSIVDFLKITFISDEKNYKEAWNKFVKRIVVGIVFFLLPQIISLVINIAGLQDSGIIFEILS